MQHAIVLLLLGITTFVATNLDDFPILTVLFAGKKTVHHTRHVFWGVFLGFTLIIVLSLIGLLLNHVLSRQLIGLLGFIPLWIGFRELLGRGDEPGQDDLPGFQREGSGRWQKLVILSRRPGLSVYVAAITVGNGGDNVVLYASLFANHTWKECLFIVFIYYFLLGIKCAVAIALVAHPAASRLLAVYGALFTPWIYIFIGTYILISSTSYGLL
jgi:cadmium resistance protein CadD (predicted permease)